jgi:hypothetical protein
VRKSCGRGVVRSLVAADSATMAPCSDGQDRRAFGGGLRTLISYAPALEGGNKGLPQPQGRRGNCTVDTRPPIKVVLQGEPARLALPPSKALAELDYITRRGAGTAI